MGSVHGLGPAISTSTLITSNTFLILDLRLELLRDVYHILYSGSQNKYYPRLFYQYKAKFNENYDIHMYLEEQPPRSKCSHVSFRREKIDENTGYYSTYSTFMLGHWPHVQCRNWRVCGQRNCHNNVHRSWLGPGTIILVSIEKNFTGLSNYNFC